MSRRLGPLENSILCSFSNTSSDLLLVRNYARCQGYQGKRHSPCPMRTDTEMQCSTFSHPPHYFPSFNATSLSFRENLPYTSYDFYIFFNDPYFDLPNLSKFLLFFFSSILSLTCFPLPPQVLSLVLAIDLT